MSNTELPVIKGLILAGGKSTRMGHDKSLIAYHKKPQREFLFDLLKEKCDNVYTSCKKSDAVPAHLHPLPDMYTLESPLNGILSAFASDASCAWLVVAVDMPFVNLQTIEFLIAHRATNKVATCFPDSEGQRPEPLLSLWEPKAWPLLQRFYENGNISPRLFLQQHDIRLVPVPDRKMLVNINTEEERKRWKKG